MAGNNDGDAADAPSSGHFGRARHEVLLEGRRLRKAYGAVVALDGVDVTMHPGEVLGIIGDNGAGKSTLVKILAGAVEPDEGEILLDGERVHLDTPARARRYGIETVFQELALSPNRDVVENLYLGKELCRGGVITPLRVLRRREMRKAAQRQLDQLEVSLPRIRGMPIERMSGGQRQCVAVARAAFWSSKMLFMDEPTAALGVRESRAVLELVRRVAAGGTAVALISHAMPHVVEVADRIMVMRHGRKVADLRERVEVGDLVKLIVGS